MATAGGAPFIVVVALKPIAAEFDWPRTVPALCFSLAMLGMGAGGIAMGRWSDRVGVALPAMVGVIMVCAGAWLSSVSSTKWGLYIAHGLLIGLFGNAALFAPLLANTARWFDRRRGIAIAVVASGQTVSGMIWPPVLRHFVDAYGWREAFELFALIVLCIGLPAALLLRRRVRIAVPDTGRIETFEQSPGVFGLDSRIVLAMLCVAIIGCCVAMSMPMVHLVAYATDLGFSTIRAAELLSVLLGCAVVSRIFWGLLADRVGGLRALLFGSVCQATFLSAFCFVETLPAFYIVAALFGLGFGGIVPSYPLIIREHFSISGIGWRTGTVLLFGTIGMALGGWIGAFVFDVTGSYQSAFLIGVAFNTGNVVIIGSLILRQTRYRLSPSTA
ncbi:MAG: MFS transporter [Gammaproteobacteria bacterium]|nr:MFS transporter [Gammaproteobacteria bacterium]